MEKYVKRTDLACEIGQDIRKDLRAGIRTVERVENGIRTLVTDVEPGEGERCSGRAAGRYVTVYTKEFWLSSAEEYGVLCRTIATVLSKMTRDAFPCKNNAELKILIAGLGNRFITSDALGPLTTDRLIATRHIRETNTRLFHLIGNCEISLLAPGVVGQTGFEAAELIRGAAECAKPDLILAIDALASCSCERLGTTVQIANRGIMPGSGIGNHRQSIDSDTMKIPVFSLGIPTVVSSSTLILEAMEKAGMQETDGRMSDVLKNGESYFVTPKECDTVVAEGAKLLADAISHAYRL